MFWRALVVSFLVAIAFAQDEAFDQTSNEGPPVVDIQPQDAMEGVTELSSKEFAGFSLPWVVYFYAPWSSWAIRFAPVWSEVGLLLGKETEVLRVGKFDCHTDNEFAEKHDVHGYPAIILFSGEKTMHYNGNWDPQSIADFVYHEGGLKKPE